MRALSEAGLDPTGLHRADSVTNEVWLTPEYVVRVNRDASMRLYREAVLSQVLPHEVGYPPVIQHGGEMGSDWLLLERLQGVSLSRAWPELSQEQRRRAVRQLSERLRAVHDTACPRLDGLTDVPQLLDPAPTGAQAVVKLIDGLDRASTFKHVDAGITSDAIDMVETLAGALDPFDAVTVVHGDLTFENVLWDGSDVTAVLDFEFARPGPRDLDLDVLLRFISLPHLHVPAEYEAQTKVEDYADVPWWMAEDYPELFAHPRQFDRSRIYSIAWDVRELLAFPPNEPLHTVHRHHPYRRLANVLRGSSYLDRLNGAVILEF